MEEIQKAVKSIIETLYRQSLVLNAMSEGIGAMMVLHHNSLDKCQMEDCDSACTFCSKTDQRRVCDRHYAKSIIDRGEEAEEDWDPVSGSQEIRVVQDFVSTRKFLMSSDDDLN